MTILIYADEVLTARVFAARHGQKIDANQEFVGIGTANIGAGFLTGFPAALSASRTAVNDQMGGKSQWVGLFAAALTIIFLLFLTPLLAPLPTVALGAIIIVASLGLIDGCLPLLAAGASRRVLAGGGHRLGCADCRCFAGHTRGCGPVVGQCDLSSRGPHDALLDELDASGGTVYRGVADKETALTEPGLIVYRFDAPLVFPNAGFFTERLEELVARAGAELKCVVFDSEAISDFDSTAAEALENLDADLERRGVELWIARANEPLRDLLRVTGLTKRLGKDNIYPSVRARGDGLSRALWYDIIRKRWQ